MSPIEILKECAKLLEEKNNQYSQGSFYGNFERGSKLCGGDKYSYLLALMAKHVDYVYNEKDRLNNLNKIRESLRDIINYCALYEGMLVEEAEQDCISSVYTGRLFVTKDGVCAKNEKI